MIASRCFARPSANLRRAVLATASGVSADADTDASREAELGAGGETTRAGIGTGGETNRLIAGSGGETTTADIGAGGVTARAEAGARDETIRAGAWTDADVGFWGR